MSESNKKDTVDLLPLTKLEELAIKGALKATGGNISRAAKVLGIGRATLYRKMRKYDIDYERYES